MKARLTKTVVEAIPPAGRDVYAWDDKVSGFGLKVTPAGRRIYVLKYGVGRADRWLRLGEHGVEVTAEEARRKAIRARGEIANGKDPALARGKLLAELTVAECDGPGCLDSFRGRIS